MGTLRVTRKFIVFSARSRRRFFAFVIIFAILSGATILLVSSFDEMNRQGLLDYRGVVAESVTMGSIGYTTGQQETIESAIGSSTPEEIIYYRYFDFSSSVRIFSYDLSYAWAHPDVNPDNLLAGNFPRNSRNILISSDTIFSTLGSGGNSIEIDLSVGSKISFTGSDTLFTVSGIYDKPGTITDLTHEWVFIPEASFNELVTDLSIGSVYIQCVVILAGGDYIFSNDAYKNVESIATSLISGLGTGWNVDYETAVEKEEERNTNFLMLLFGLFGTFVVSTLYSYIITRFRRREVAILKTMGYSKTHVRIAVLTEIILVAVVGFLTGLVAIQMFKIMTKTGAYIHWIYNSPTAILAFFAVVASCIPGFLMITMRTLKVRPIEIFRQK